jgi:hypothetical protein
MHTEHRARRFGIAVRGAVVLAAAVLAHHLATPRHAHGAVEEQTGEGVAGPEPGGSTVSPVVPSQDGREIVRRLLYDNIGTFWRGFDYRWSRTLPFTDIAAALHAAAVTTFTFRPFATVTSAVGVRFRRRGVDALGGRGRHGLHDAEELVGVRAELLLLLQPEIEGGGQSHRGAHGRERRCDSDPFHVSLPVGCVVDRGMFHVDGEGTMTRSCLFRDRIVTC